MGRRTGVLSRKGLLGNDDRGSGQIVGNSYLIAHFSQLLTSAVARQPEVFLDTADYLIDAVRQNTIPLWMMHA